MHATIYKYDKHPIHAFFVFLSPSSSSSSPSPSSSSPSSSSTSTSSSSSSPSLPSSKAASADALTDAVERRIEALRLCCTAEKKGEGSTDHGISFAGLCAQPPLDGPGGRHRVAVLAPDPASAIALLQQFLSGEASAAHESEVWQPGGSMVVAGVAPSTPQPLCFLMSDVGTDWWGSGSWLMPGGSTRLMFGADGSGLDAATATLVAKGWPDPIPLLHSPADHWRTGAEATPAQTHSALFSLHVALLSVWRQLGVVPDAVMSFSMGEPSGAVACGALSEAAGAAVMSAMTSCVMTASEGMGGMLAVIGLTAEELTAQAAMQDGVEVGAVFGRAGGALTGTFEGVSAVEARLRRDARVKVVLRPPVIKAPYHSAAFEPMQQAFREEVAAALEPSSEAPSGADTSESSGRSSRVVPWFTSIDGGHTAEPMVAACSPDFWWTGLRAPALSQNATEAALDAGYRIFLELNGSPFYCIHPVGDEMTARDLIGTCRASEQSTRGTTASWQGDRAVSDEQHAEEKVEEMQEACGLTLCTIRHDVSEVRAESQLLGALCRIWVAGASVDWSTLLANTTSSCNHGDEQCGAQPVL